MNRTVAITGATGFAGRHVAAELLRRGHRLVALARDPVRATLPSEVRVIAGDLGNPAALAALVTGADCVVHLAGAVTALGREGYFRVNAEGAETLAAAAARASVGRFIHVSSLAAREPLLSAYGASKRAGEEAVARHGAGMSLLVLRPPALYGPGDRATLPLLKALTGRIAVIPGRRDQRFSLLHVRDLARLIADAVTSESDGTFEVSDGRALGYDWSAIAAAAARVAGHPVRPFFLPRAVATGIAFCVEAMGHLSGRPGMLSRGKVAELYHGDWVARGPGPPLGRTLTFEEGFGETVAWYRQEGWLPRGGGADRSGATARHGT
jgi:nucleoside-diphosphate-sugar epimerase